MCCAYWLAAITLAIATWAAFVLELPRTRPHLFGPIFIAFIVWTLAAVIQLWSDYFSDPRALTIEAGLATLGAIVSSVVCVVWFGVAVLVSQYRSRK